MAVVVVRTDRDDAHARSDCGQERRVAVRAAVVRNLQDVRAQVDAGREQLLLGFDLGVSRKQDAHAADGRAHNDRRVVGVGSRAVKRPRRAEHVQGHIAHMERRTWCRTLDHELRRPQRRRHEADA